MVYLTINVLYTKIQKVQFDALDVKEVKISIQKDEKNKNAKLSGQVIKNLLKKPFNNLSF